MNHLQLGSKFWIGKKYADHLIIPPKALDFYRSKVKLEPHIPDFRSSVATLIPLSALKKGFDCLIQFWILVANASTQTEFDKGTRNLCANIQSSSHWIKIVVSLDNSSSTNQGMMKNDIISCTLFVCIFVGYKV